MRLTRGVGRIMRGSLDARECEYEERKVLHAQRHKGRVVVIDQVPALVCLTCGEVQFTLETAEGIERLLAAAGEPATTAPVFEYV